MIRAIITPQNNFLTLNISIPNSYIGKEIEVLLYAKDEPIQSPAVKNNNAARFKGILNTDEANKFSDYLIQARKEWDRL